MCSAHEVTARRKEIKDGSDHGGPRGDETPRRQFSRGLYDCRDVTPTRAPERGGRRGKGEFPVARLQAVYGR